MQTDPLLGCRADLILPVHRERLAFPRMSLVKRTGFALLLATSCASGTDTDNTLIPHSDAGTESGASGAAGAGGSAGEGGSAGATSPDAGGSAGSETGGQGGEAGQGATSGAAGQGTGGIGGTAGAAAGAGGAGGFSGAGLDPDLALPASGDDCEVGEFCWGNIYWACRISSPTGGTCESCPYAALCGVQGSSCSQSDECGTLYQCYQGKCAEICELGVDGSCAAVDCVDVGHQSYGVCVEE